MTGSYFSDCSVQEVNSNFFYSFALFSLVNSLTKYREMTDYFYPLF